MDQDTAPLFLYLQVGQHLGLTPNDYQTALEWLAEDSVFCAALACEAGQKPREEGLHLLDWSTQLRADGASRRLLGPGEGDER